MHTLTGWVSGGCSLPETECCTTNLLVIDLVTSRLPVVCMEDADLLNTNRGAVKFGKV